MSDQTTIRAEMRTRAASLPGDSSLPPDAPTPAVKKGRAWPLWLACALAGMAVIWWLRRG